MNAVLQPEPRRWEWLDGRPRDTAGLIFKLAGGETQCLGPDWHDAEVLIDPQAEIRSGNIIRCVAAYSDGTRLDMLKELRWSHAARHWYLCAFDVNGEWHAAVTPNLVRLEFAQIEAPRGWQADAARGSQGR